MKIKNIKLKDFKRFKELTISDLPETAKLVVLVGPNGCGKSSLFDAIYSKMQTFYVGFNQSSGSYYDRIGVRSDINLVFRGVDVSFYGEQPNDKTACRKAVYVRSAHRNDPHFSIDRLKNIGSALEETRIQRMIDNDQATGRNYMHLVSQAVEDVFEKTDDQTTLLEFREEMLTDIRSAMQDLFPDLILNSLGNPLSGNATFRFDKGATSGFTYENLSGGEKTAFDLILDLVVKRREYDDTVFCIDEPEAHMSTRLQKDLLASLYGLIPQNCQLWIATHSIGMVRKAQEIQRENPDEVVFLDLGNRDFDVPQVIEPSKPTRTFWQSMYEIALDDLAALVVPARIILCEGNAGKDGFDAQCYNKIFGNEFPNTLFVSARGKNQVKILVPVIQAIAEGSTVLSLTDRDRHNADDRERVRQAGSFILKRRTLENYLLDAEVLKLLCEKMGRPEIAGTLISLRNANITGGDVRSGNAKNAAVKIYEVAEAQLGIEHPGAVHTTFLIEHSAPLITPDTAIYKELKSDIFGE